MMAERSGLAKSTIVRIWKGFGLKPHLSDGFKLSNDPLFRGQGLRRGRALLEPGPYESARWCCAVLPQYLSHFGL